MKKRNRKYIKYIKYYLQKYKNTIILISHDIKFLDEVCTNMLCF